MSSTTSQRISLFTSESVSAGHPDKLADRISDTILDRFLAAEPSARVACETFLTDNLVVLGGEFHTVDPAVFARIRDEAPDLVRALLRDTGYSGDFPGIDPDRCEILLRFSHQSADIRQGVERGEEIGAGDQGLMFGCACDETPELMPLPILLAHRLVERQEQLRRSGELPWLRPDAKSQVTVRYRGDRPEAVDTVVLSTQHDAGVDIDTLRREVAERIIHPVLPAHLCPQPPRVLINPTGRFVVGGPMGDTGLTGRKIIVDTYGGRCPHGGGAFSGKDPSKVDRSSSYMGRYVAKNIVAAGLATEVEVQVAYAIGISRPVSINVKTFGTGRIAEERLVEVVAEVFDLRPKAIIRQLDLLRPIYRKTAAYGHFGRELAEFTWERTDRVDDLRAAAGV